MLLYLTQDQLGTPTGGGAVTYHEYAALTALGDEAHPIDRTRFAAWADPFAGDALYEQLLWGVQGLKGNVKLSHLYAGCFTKTVAALKAMGSKVAYTAAAHDIGESRKEFEGLGVKFDLPHLTEEHLWKQYVGGYVNADLVVCPSTLSKKCMESYGCKNVVVIPHGCDLPAELPPPPKTFTVGYMGQAGADKGLRYLLAAWKKLNLKDARLLIAGNNIQQAVPLWRAFGGANVEFMGFVKHISEFFSRVSVYVQPSVTEGFGIEVLEAMAYGRPTIVSEGAGAVDLVRDLKMPCVVVPRDVDGLAQRIEDWRRMPPEVISGHAMTFRSIATAHTWERVRSLYVAAWKKLLGRE
jgi:glycosyltransferase involved in cell wall biosynthesis